MLTDICSHWTDFFEIPHLRIFKKSNEKLQGSLQFHKDQEYFTKISVYIYDNIALNLSWNQNYLKLVEKIKTRFRFNNFLFQKSCC